MPAKGRHDVCEIDGLPGWSDVLYELPLEPGLHDSWPPVEVCRGWRVTCQGFGVAIPRVDAEIAWRAPERNKRSDIRIMPGA